MRADQDDVDYCQFDVKETLYCLSNCVNSDTVVYKSEFKCLFICGQSVHDFCYKC